MRHYTLLFLLLVFIFSGCADSSSNTPEAHERGTNQEVIDKNQVSTIKDSITAADSSATSGNSLKENLAKNVPSSTVNSVSAANQSKLELSTDQSNASGQTVGTKPIVSQPVSTTPVTTTSPSKSNPVTIPRPVYTKVGPRISFNHKNYKYGTIKEGKEINHVFYFKNTGDEPLEILNVSVTCGCTVPTYSFLPILPGESSKINVHYDSKGKMAAQKATITVLTNSKSNPTEKLFLEGYVMPVWKDEKKDSTKTEEKPLKKEVYPEKEEESQANKDDKLPEEQKETPPGNNDTEEKSDSTDQGN